MLKIEQFQNFRSILSTFVHLSVTLDLDDSFIGKTRHGCAQLQLVVLIIYNYQLQCLIIENGWVTLGPFKNYLLLCSKENKIERLDQWPCQK